MISKFKTISVPIKAFSIKPYNLNSRPNPNPPQNNDITANKRPNAVNDNIDSTVLFIVLSIAV